MRWAVVPKRALTISKKVLAPLAFRLTADAMTEKNTIETLHTNEHRCSGVLNTNLRSTHAIPPATGDAELINDEG